jgi:hypothetical protein
VKQYCRYCAFCIAPDDEYYCDLKDTFVSGRSENHCKDFALSELGDADGSGRQYRPRAEKRVESSIQGQMRMEGIP